MTTRRKRAFIVQDADNPAGWSTRVNAESPFDAEWAAITKLRAAKLPPERKPARLVALPVARST